MPQSHKLQKNTNLKKSPHQSKGAYVVSKKKLIVIVVVLLAVLNFFLLSVVLKIKTLESQQNTVVSISEPRTYNDVTVTVTNVKEETNYVMGILPSDAEKIIGLTLSISNNSNEPFEIYPAIQSFIRDDQGDMYTMVPVALGDPFEAKTLQPGESETGELSYLVTNRAIPLLYYIENRQSNIGPFVIKLQ